MKDSMKVCQTFESEERLVIKGIKGHLSLDPLTSHIFIAKDSKLALIDEKSSEVNLIKDNIPQNIGPMFAENVMAVIPTPYTSDFILLAGMVEEGREKGPGIKVIQLSVA